VSPAALTWIVVALQMVASVIIGGRQGRQQSARRPWIFLPGLALGGLALLVAYGAATSPLAVYAPHGAYEGLVVLATVYFIPVGWLLTWLAYRMARRRLARSAA
jgi:hypothetical protein